MEFAFSCRKTDSKWLNEIIAESTMKKIDKVIGIRRDWDHRGPL